MKFCIVGNSHISCLKKAVDEFHFNDKFEFFGSYAESVSDIVCKDNRILAKSDLVRKSWMVTSGKEFIDIDDYDVILFHGLSGRLRNLNNILMASNDLSLGLVEESLVFSTDTIDKVLDTIPEAFFSKIVISSRPNERKAMFSESNINSPEEFLSKYNFVVDSSILAHSRFGLRYLPQPYETLSDIKLTQNVFGKGSVGLGKAPSVDGYKATSEEDTKHMNSSYGNIVVNKLIELVAKPDVDI